MNSRRSKPNAKKHQKSIVIESAKGRVTHKTISLHMLHENHNVSYGYNLFNMDKEVIY